MVACVLGANWVERVTVASLQSPVQPQAGAKVLPRFRAADCRSACQETRAIDLHSNRLSNLDGIEQFIAIESLVADYNFLTEDAFEPSEVQDAFAGVETLWINGNRIFKLDKFVRLMKPLSRLGSLSLLRNPAVPPKENVDAFKQYRQYVIHNLPNLHTLDGKLITEKERREIRLMRESASWSDEQLPPLLRSPDLLISKSEQVQEPDETTFVAIREGLLKLIRLSTSQSSSTTPEAQEFWFVLNERKLQWYPDWRAVAPVDIIYLRRQFMVKEVRQEENDAVYSMLLSQHLFPIKLLKNDDKEVLYLVAPDENVQSSWSAALKEQTGQKRATMAELAVSEFTRIQQERNQYFQEEEDKRLLELQRRIATLPIEHIDPQEVRFVRILGMGSFGTVYHAIYRDRTIACKLLHEHAADSFILEEFVNEIEMLVKCRDPNVLMVWGVCFNPKMIFMELLRTNLTKFFKVNIKPRMDQKLPSLLTRLRIARDGATAVNFLHNLQPMIVHRDIKPQNFLVDDNYRVVVADFGLSETLKKGRSTWDERGALRGTIAYCAPEVLKGNSFDEKSDVYGYALVMLVLYTCEEPWTSVFPAGDYAEFTRRVLFENMRPLIPAEMPPRLSKLIESCWDADASKRPSFDEIVEQLDLVMLDVAISPEQRLDRSFWEHHFGSRYQVDFDEFMGYVSRYIPVRNEIDEAVVKYLFTYGSVGTAATVSVERYGRVLRWFGPLAAYSSYAVTQRMVATTKHRWFHGFITMNLAISLLAEQPPGTFLVRFCNSRKKGHFFILYVHELNDIRFLRVIRVSTLPPQAPRLSTSKLFPDGNYYLDGVEDAPPAPSLPVLVERLQEGSIPGVPKLERPAPGWPFAKIHLHIESPDLRGT